MIAIFELNIIYIFDYLNSIHFKNFDEKKKFWRKDKRWSMQNPLYNIRISKGLLFGILGPIVIKQIGID